MHGRAGGGEACAVDLMGAWERVGVGGLAVPAPGPRVAAEAAVPRAAIKGLGVCRHLQHVLAEVHAGRRRVGGWCSMCERRGLLSKPT